MQESLIPQIKVYLQASEFCDSDSPLIQRAARNILFQTSKDPQEMIRSLFYWVRDNIEYHVGLKGKKASETLLEGSGSCSHKANLFIALLRAVGIPAGFMLLEVQTRSYFGPTALERFKRFFSEKSLHIYSAVFLQDRWIELDNTDDIRMGHGFYHLSPQCKPVEWNGESQSLLNLEASHILSKSPAPMPSIDSIFQKSTRLSEDVLHTLNSYMVYLRRFGVLIDRVEEIEAQFFKWYAEQHPHQHRKFLLIEEIQNLRDQKLFMEKALEHRQQASNDKLRDPNAVELRAGAPDPASTSRSTSNPRPNWSN